MLFRTSGSNGITAYPEVLSVLFCMRVLIRSAALPWSVWETPPPGASLRQRQVPSGSSAQLTGPSGSAGFLPRRTDPRLTAGEMDGDKEKGKEAQTSSQSPTHGHLYK